MLPEPTHQHSHGGRTPPGKMAWVQSKATRPGDRGQLKGRTVVPGIIFRVLAVLPTPSP